ncbi:hypothetical protein AVEN_83052-1 [Araneus ventricosus]|uniref:Tc1-like transposase DDE domain-containing protein n=1 Tax=Araneus ventricosus TaxID=182803 RepID=A0A4Y2ANY4_ARAVE|nr:hypothetical protein AVEN_83052-1 [Araneus ventricosus]
MLQFASSDSSAESDIAKAESMSRRNHLHDDIRWRIVGILQACARQSAIARESTIGAELSGELNHSTDGGAAGSPDLNPIEHVWDMLGRRIAGSSVPPGTLHELQKALLQEWALMPQQAINDTIASVPHRCQACISARGYHTRYYRVVPIAHSATNLGCCAATAVIYVLLFAFALLFDMWSSSATPTSCTTFTHIH